MQGLVEFADSSIVVRARIKTLPGKQWALGRAYNEHLKEVFDERQIEIPFPHLTMYFGEDKKGQAPPLRIQSEHGDSAPIAFARRSEDLAAGAAAESRSGA
jgi:small conductance mechanosensitive channel